MNTAGPALPMDRSGWKAYFDEYAPRYETSAFSGDGLAYVGMRELAAVTDSLSTIQTGRVLDAGAGSGRLSRVLAGAGWDVTALDASSEMLGLLARDLPQVRVLESELGTVLPLSDREFDAVVSLRVLKYVDDLVLALSEFARVLRPGGLAVLEIANGRSLARFGYQGAPIHFNSVSGFERMMRGAGLEPAWRRAGTRLPQPIWSAARATTARRAASALDRALGTLLGGDRTAAGARSVIISGLRV